MESRADTVAVEQLSVRSDAGWRASRRACAGLPLCGMSHQSWRYYHRSRAL